MRRAGPVGSGVRKPVPGTVGQVRHSLDKVERRKRRYLVLMGICLGLILLAWNVVRLWSTAAAVVMSIVAAVIPPVAVILANTGWRRRT